MTEIAELRNRIERQVEEYIEIVKELDRLSRTMTQRVVPATYHDD